ncbi:hypothetical protein Vadar_021397 [Vaccinium darrowii]|uniref:Uncharacterized protein n=1 Tax=Vaccinium darrowii TaxID=229202 RepID=A0ACB7XBP2_9ERIC|nr:hypothetical protein Vadar_021397 [Vaccinium darrowii]
MDRDPMDYVHNCYSVQTYLKTYDHVMGPINGKDMWPIDGYPKLLPPNVKKRAGKPKKAMRREPDEDEEQQPVEKQTRLRKKGVKMTCGVCGKTGHNKRSCKQVGSNAGGEVGGVVEEGNETLNVPIYSEVTTVGTGQVGGGSSTTVNIARGSQTEVGTEANTFQEDSLVNIIVDEDISPNQGHTMMWRGTKLYFTSSSPAQLVMNLCLVMCHM